MAISGNARVSAALNPYNFNPIRTSTHFIPPSKGHMIVILLHGGGPNLPEILSPLQTDWHDMVLCENTKLVVVASVYIANKSIIVATSSISKEYPSGSEVDCNVFVNGTSSVSRSVLDGHTIRCHSKGPLGNLGEYRLSSNSFSQEVESFLLNAINMNFFERLNLAWKIIFPSPISRRNSNANIAKQRLKMILFSDRCAVSDEAKQKIVSNVVSVLSDFVEIESQDKVQLSVSTDPDVGTIYSVTVPVRRVRSQYQLDDETGSITNIEYKDTGESSGAVDVKFDFYIPGDEY
ncbi:hypothetical protein ACJIZ3_025133 [Penstemon smallii]|uniref:Cell division topological specificity factor n=1 Tax=Penstemon smallii TaxID=265156 RepID=A0ABD3TTZ1_9LAMI